jgi:hypothetical protein
MILFNGATNQADFINALVAHFTTEFIGPFGAVSVSGTGCFVAIVCKWAVKLKYFKFQENPQNLHKLPAYGKSALTK